MKNTSSLALLSVIAALMVSATSFAKNSCTAQEAIKYSGMDPDIVDTTSKKILTPKPADGFDEIFTFKTDADDTWTAKCEYVRALGGCQCEPAEKQ